MKKKILICSFEYYPKGKGIANLAYHTRNEFESLDYDVDVCSTIGPEIKKGSLKLVEKLGGFGIIYYWILTSFYLFFNHKKYDKIYLHNPMLFLPIFSKNVCLVVHTLYLYMFLDYAKNRFINWFYYPIIIFFESISYFLFNRGKEVIVTSPTTKKELKSYLINSENSKIIFNGLVFKDKVEKSKIISRGNKNQKIFVNVCRLDNQKNLFKLLEFFSKLDKKEYKLYIAGDGSLREDLESYIKIHKLTNVILLGFVPHNEIYSLYKSSDFFISSSVYEGYPLVLSESMGMGAIPILSEIEIYQYTLNKVGSGLILDFSDSSKAKKQLLKYLGSISITSESKKVESFARNNLSWNKIAKEYLK